MTAETRLVVDASVAVKWIVPEEYRPQAVALITAYSELLAPDFILIEVANTLVKKWRRGELDLDSAKDGPSQIRRLIGPEPTIELLSSAVEIALRHQRSVYDALYVALALNQGCQLVTADERLHNALRPALPETMLWVGDLPAPA